MPITGMGDPYQSAAANIAPRSSSMGFASLASGYCVTESEWCTTWPLLGIGMAIRINENVAHRENGAIP